MLKLPTKERSKSPSSSPTASRSKSIHIVAGNNSSSVFGSFHPMANEGMDWYGNSRLHSCIGSNSYYSPDCIYQIHALVEEYPEALKIPNQFGRLPLHYALDRLSGKLNIEVIKYLIECYPEASTIRDNAGKDCYDICEDWGHKTSVKRLVLESSPVFFERELMDAIYGKHLAQIFHTIKASVTGSSSSRRQSRNTFSDLQVPDELLNNQSPLVHGLAVNEDSTLCDTSYSTVELSQQEADNSIPLQQWSPRSIDNEQL